MKEYEIIYIGYEDGEILQMVINTILILPYLGLMYILLWKKRANSI